MSQYRKRPVVIEAVRFHASDIGEPLVFDDIPEWLAFAIDNGVVKSTERGEDYWYLTIKTLEGDMLASPGDWIIQGIQGKVYPCKPEIFAATYEPVEESA